MFATHGSHNIAVEPIDGGTRLVLPTRHLGGKRHFGWAVVAFGLMGTILMSLWISIPFASAVKILAQGQAVGLLVLVFACLGFYGWLQSLKILWLGAAIIRDRTQCVVELQEGWLASVERLGWFRWKRRCPLAEIKRFEIRHVLDGDNALSEQQSTSPLLDADWLAIHAVGVQNKDGLTLAPAYPREIIEPLASQLSDCILRAQTESLQAQPIRRKTDDHPTSQPDHAIPVIDNSVIRESGLVSIAKPHDSKIRVHDRPPQRAFEIPPAGIFKGSHGLFPFCGIWLLITGVVSVLMVLDLAQNPPGLWPALGTVGFLLLFWGVGTSLTMVAVNMGRRRVMIGVLDDQLFIERKSIFGSKWIELGRDAISRVCVGPSGMKINDRPVMELQIHAVGGTKHGLLSQLTLDELRWLSNELNQALALEWVSRTDNWKNLVQDVPDETQNLSDSPPFSVDVQRYSGKTIITIKPLGFSKFLEGLTVGGGVLMAIAVGIIAYSWFDAVLSVIAACLCLVGLTMIVGRLVYITRQHRIEVTKNHILVSHRDWFSQSSREIAIDQVEWIDVQPSGTRLNEVDIMQLTIHCSGSPKVNLMFGRPLQEIGQVAAVLNDLLPQPPVLNHTHSPTAGRQPVEL